MGQISVSVKIDPTRGRRAMNARKYKIRKEVENRESPFHLQKKERLQGRERLNDTGLHDKGPSIENRNKALVVLGSSPRSPIPLGVTS